MDPDIHYWFIRYFGFGIMHTRILTLSQGQNQTGVLWMARSTKGHSDHSGSEKSSAEDSVCNMFAIIALRFQSVNYCGDMMRQREMAVTCKLLFGSVLTHSYP